MPARAREEPLVLLQFPSAFGAPSLAAECTKVHAYLKFCDAPFATLDAKNTNANWVHNLPLLRIGARCVNPENIIQELKQIGFDPDEALSSAQAAEALAFEALVEERIGVALLYSLWADETNYASIVRPTYAASLPIPLSLYLPWTMRRRALSQLARRGYKDSERAYMCGEDALAALSVRLRDADYFHGSAPCRLDATAFAYLSAILRCPLPHDRLRTCLSSFPNLERFCHRVSERYFGGSEAILPSAPVPRSIKDQVGSGVYSWVGPSDVEGESSRSRRTPKQQRFKDRGRAALLAGAASAVLFTLPTRDEEGDETYEEYEASLED